MDARPRRAQYGAHVACLRRSARGAYARRHPRQRDTVLAHEHDGLFSSPVLGKQARVLCPEKRPGPDCCDGVSGRALSGAEELDRESLSQAHSLQQGRQRWPLRRVGAAGHVRDRAPRRLQISQERVMTSTTGILIAAVMVTGFANRLSGQSAHPPISPSALPTIVLVHGAFADGSSWSKVIPILQRDGYTDIAVQPPLTSLAADVETTKRA